MVEIFALELQMVFKKFKTNSKLLQHSGDFKYCMSAFNTKGQMF